MKMIIKSAAVVDPVYERVTVQDIYMNNGRIVQPFADDPAQIIDATGLYALPGLVDLHVHFRDPGQTRKEDVFSGAAAAAAGGVTSVIAMPNTVPVMDNPQVLRELLERAESAPIHVYQAACITAGMKSERLTDFAALKAAGAAAFSDDGLPVRSDELMERALVEAKRLGLPVLSHSEILPLAAGGKVNEGEVSRRLGVKGMPAAAEYEAVAREIALSEKTGCPLHICHVSTAESVERIRAAKKRGVPVTCETAPHYFTFTEEELLKRDADYRMNPPLRTARDQAAVTEGLADGTIDAIATDHAPHTAAEKADFEAAPNGVVGLETSLSAAYTKLVKGGVMHICRLARLMSYQPAKIAGIPGGLIDLNEPADIALFDPGEDWTVVPQELHGKSQNTPFKGRTLCGKVKYTVCGGEIVFGK